MILLAYVWASAPPIRVRVVRSWLPRLLGADSFVFRRTIRTRLALPTPTQLLDPHFDAPGVLDADELRHELVHVEQYARYGTLGFLWRYLTGHRRALEAEAHAAATGSLLIPRWTLLRAD